MKTLTTYIRLILVSMTLTACVTSCQRANVEPVDPIDPNEEYQDVSLTIKVPTISIPQTKALGDTEEYEVNTIEIFLFDNAGNLKHQPIYCNSIDNTNANKSIKTFSIRIPKGTYDMFIVANAHNEVASKTFSTTTDTKATVFTKLKKACSGMWNADPSVKTYYIPMWGEVKNVAIPTPGNAIGTVPLTRMLARVDVDASAAKTANGFFLEEVWVYNPYKAGYIIPNFANATIWNSTANKALLPTTISSDKPPLGVALSYSSKILPVGVGMGAWCKNEIYIAESPKPATTSVADLNGATFIIIKGTYNGTSGYYRLDFAIPNNGSIKYLDILRNHRYLFNIKSVTCAGFGDVTSAIATPARGVDVDLVVWDDAIEALVDDGQNLMGVTPREFNLYREKKSDNVIDIITTYSGTINIQMSQSDVNATPTSTWMRQVGGLVNGGVAGKYTRKLTFEVDANTAPGATARTNYIHITAGNMKYVVKVVQSEKSNVKLMLKLESAGTYEEFAGSDLSFAQTANNIAPGTKLLRVEWTPSNVDVKVTKISAGANDFDFTGGSVIAAGSYVGTNGKLDYTLNPNAMNLTQAQLDAFYERSATYMFEITSDGKTETKILTLRHSVNHAYAIVQPSYFLNGGTHNLVVKSNVPWEMKNADITVTNNPTLPSLVSSFTDASGGANTTTGVNVPIRLHNEVTTPHNPYIGGSKITLKIRSTDPKQPFTTASVVMDCKGFTPATGTYKALPGMIGVRQSNGELTLDGWTAADPVWLVYFKWGSLIALKYEVFSNAKASIAWAPPAFINAGKLATVSGFSSISYYSKDSKTIAQVQATAGNEALGFGDPCKYATMTGGGNFRMPTGNPYEGFPKYIYPNGGSNGGAKLTYNATTGYTFTLTGAVATKWKSSTLQIPFTGGINANGSLSGGSTIMADAASGYLMGSGAGNSMNTYLSIVKSSAAFTVRCLPL